SRTHFSEATTGDAGVLANGQEVTLSPGGGWIQSPIEDLVVSLLNGGNVVAAGVSYVGNGGQPFGRSDLNFDGALSIDDWAIFNAGASTDLSGLSGAERYRLGDLDGDGDNDFEDFRLFKDDFIAANGVGAWESLLQVPEPATAASATLALFA